MMIITLRGPLPELSLPYTILRSEELNYERVNGPESEITSCDIP